MRKLFLLAFALLAMSVTSFAQSAPDNNNTTPAAENATEIPNMGRAPRELDGIGRLDLRVVDENGNPVKGVRADLESRRLNGFLCEAWNWTDARGVSVLPALHMGRLTLKLKANGFQTQQITVDPNSLDQPVRVTMLHKK